MNDDETRFVVYILVFAQLGGQVHTTAMFCSETFRETDVFVASSCVLTQLRRPPEILMANLTSDWWLKQLLGKHPGVVSSA